MVVVGERAGLGAVCGGSSAKKAPHGRIVGLADPDTLMQAAHASGLALRLLEAEADVDPGERALIP